jgi:hypothetical protein
MSKLKNIINNLNQDKKPGILENVFGFIGIASALPSIILYFIIVYITKQVKVLLSRVWK